MDPERWERVKRIYSSALECGPDEQESFLNEACGGDDSLRKEVETLLAQQRKADGFMQAPAMEVAAHVMAKDQGKAIAESLAGQSVAHYSIIEKIGEGGMGVVYRAKDTRLDRHVAIKSLPDIFAADPVRMARFEREAKILATLNHPNIASIYGLEESDGKRFLVMELVEGKTLAEQLKKGRIPLDETLEICRQIAVGLEAAHEKGIVHRDLKPSNIKLTPEGKVKVLDFGLAKPFHNEPGSEELSQPPAGTESRTDTGVILGTAAYMSPEQAKGKPVDKRGDIWAFGCILFECLTGKRAFPGDTISETLAAVIKEEPDWTALPKDTPEKSCELLKRCLNKEPDRRLHDIADARIEMYDSCVGKPAQAHKKTPRGIRIIAATAVAAVGIALAFLGWLWIARTRPPTPVPAVAVPIFTETGMVRHPTISPDGSEVAFSWTGEQGENLDIYCRSIAGEPVRRLTEDSRDEARPTWAPNGRFIAFFRPLTTQGVGRNGVYLIPAEGIAEPRKLAEVFTGDYAPDIEWTPDSRWLVVTLGSQPDQPAGLHLLSLDTGEMKRLTSAPAGTTGTAGDYLPALSPDAQTLAFVRVLDSGICEVYRVSLTKDFLTKGEPEKLRFENKRIWDLIWTRDGKELMYSSGYFMAGETVLKRIRISEPNSEKGYATTQESFGEGVYDLAISRKDGSLMYSRVSRDSDIYRMELPGKDGGTRGPEKFIASKRKDYCADYSPDGRKIAFVSTRSGAEEVWLCNADGSMPRQLTFIRGAQTANPRWSPNGEWIVYDSRKEGSADLYLISADGSGERRLTSNPGYEGQGKWSRDGKWIYYGCSRSGRWGLNKIPSEGGESIEVTKNDGRYGVESPDGKWIYFSRMADGRIDIWKVPIGGGDEVQVHEGPLSYTYNFVIEGDGIYFTKLDGSLEFLDFITAKSKFLAKLDGAGVVFGLPSYGLTISPDHRWLLYTKVEKPESDLMLVESFR